mgnify:FL=1
MEGWQWALVLKPFGLLLMFAPGAVLVWYLKRNLRAGWLRRILLFSWKT